MLFQLCAPKGQIGKVSAIPSLARARGRQRSRVNLRGAENTVKAQFHKQSEPIVTSGDCVVDAWRRAYRGSVSEILEDHTAIAIYSFLVVHDNTRILSFRCGRFFPRSDPLYGRRTIGLSAAVTQQHVDMLYESLFRSRRERRRGVVHRYRAAPPACGAGTLCRRNHAALRCQECACTADAPPALHMVLSYRRPLSFKPTKAALSVNDLRWIDPDVPLNSLRDFDTTSQFLLSERYAREFVCLS